MRDELDGQHTQLRYMTDFGCIGPDCEDHCCYGWRVDIDPDAYRKMMVAAQFSAKAIAPRLHAAIKVIPGSKKKKTPTRYQIRHGEDERCPMLDERNLCELVKHFGEDMLSDVCALYPRKTKRVGDHIELTATPSCPELSRKLLLRADAVDVVPLDVDSLFRLRLQGGMDTRDMRPFYRATVEVRDLVVELLRDDATPLEDRLFLMLWFAKRTNDVLRKGPEGKASASGATARGDAARVEAAAADADAAQPPPTRAPELADLESVRREMGLLRDSRVREEILRRFRQIETPASVALMVVRSMVRPNSGGGVRPNWNRLTSSIVDSYTRLREILPQSQDEADHDRAASDASERVMMTFGEVWIEYKRRRDRVRARAAGRVDQYLRNYTIHNWMHRLPTESKDVLTYTLRYLAFQAVQKFVLYSSPNLQRVLDEIEGLPDAEGDRVFEDELDRTAVDAFYQLSRHIEHGQLINFLVKMLKAGTLFSMAGGVYLIRF